METPSGQDKAYETVHLTPSADGILDVTPVSTDVEEENNEAANEGSLTTTTAITTTTTTQGQQTQTLPYRSRIANKRNEDAFSSSSEEESQCSEEEAGSEYQSTTDADQSEFDKALTSLNGKPSQGRATDFFAAPSQSFDSAEFLSQAEQQVLEEVSGIFENNSVDEDAKSRQSSITATNSARSYPTAPSPKLPPSSQSSTVISVHSTQSYPSHQTSDNIAAPPYTRMSSSNVSSSANASSSTTAVVPTMRPHPADDQLSSGVLPDMLMTMRSKIESLTLFDSDMIKIASEQVMDDNDPMTQESRESLKRSSQQSISAAVLVSLAHKRYERRRLAAMEIEKVVRSLVHQNNNNNNELERVRAILLLLSDDYVRSTSEDARKGGVVALAACAIGLKKASDMDSAVQECRDLILASVLHACQDNSQRVRYYATESLFNVVKVIPNMAIQHFFILFEILRSLYADTDVDVRSGAELLDRKLKEIIVNAMNAGHFTAEACVPVFARFVYMRNKATKRLTLTWLQELNEKLIASPILEFLHLFLGGIFDMVADPALVIRQSALAFLQSVLPKLLVVNSETLEDGDKGMKVDFDKILQSLVTTMEHPDPFVRKVAMYWMSRIVKSHMEYQMEEHEKKLEVEPPQPLSAASISVRNSLPHLLPGIFLSIGDDYHASSTSKDSFLPDQTTRALAEQTNATLQDAVRRDGQVYVQHLDSFIVALREELDSPGGLLNARYPPAVERTPYRMDVNQDGTGIESPGWFSSSGETKERGDDSMVMSRLCALHWVIVLYESVVPMLLLADYAREFVYAIIHQLGYNPPEVIVYKSLEVLATITVPVSGEDVSRSLSFTSLSGLAHPAWLGDKILDEKGPQFPMTEANISFAFDILDPSRRKLMSRNRDVFSALIQLYAYKEDLLATLTNVITYMCKLQPPEFIFVSFAVELDSFIRKRQASQDRRVERSDKLDSFSRDLRFASSFVQHMSHVLLNTEEAKDIRNVLKDCVCSQTKSERDRQRSRLFHILLHSFSHNLAATISLCFWVGAYRSTTVFLKKINPLDIDLMFLLEIDRLIEMLERPLFRHLHIRMLERDKDPNREGSGSMLFQALKLLLMMLPQSTCYVVLRDRLVSVSRFRQSTLRALPTEPPREKRRVVTKGEVDVYVTRVLQVRALHCAAAWKTIRAESLEVPVLEEEKDQLVVEEGAGRREWLGFSSKKEDEEAQEKFRTEKKLRQGSGGVIIEEIRSEYHNLSEMEPTESKTFVVTNGPTSEPSSQDVTTADVAKDSTDGERWKGYWEDSDQ